MSSTFWQEIREPEDIYGSLAPFLCVSFLTGLTPFMIKEELGKRMLKATYLGKCITVLHVCLVAYSWYRMQFDNNHIITDSVSTVGDALQYFSGGAVFIAIYGFSFFKKGELVAAMETLANIDEQLLTLGVKVKYRKMFYYSCWNFVFLTIFIASYHGISVVLLNVIDVHPGFATYTIFFMQNVVIMVTVFMFRCMTRLISDRFVVLNKVRNRCQ